MRRISDEDGRSAKHRNYGRLALSVIPAALGGAACLWLAAASGWIDLTHEITMEQRALNAVGLSIPPREPIKLVFVNDRCLHVESAYLDGDIARAIFRNTCDRQLDRPNYAYKTKAPDGTVLLTGTWAFHGNKWFVAHEKREQKVWLDGEDYGVLDSRTAVVDIFAIDQ